MSRYLKERTRDLTHSLSARLYTYPPKVYQLITITSRHAHVLCWKRDYFLVYLTLRCVLFIHLPNVPRVERPPKAVSFYKHSLHRSTYILVEVAPNPSFKVLLLDITLLYTHSVTA
jgi:hypothetical protein